MLEGARAGDSRGPEEGEGLCDGRGRVSRRSPGVLEGLHCVFPFLFEDSHNEVRLIDRLLIL